MQADAFSWDVRGLPTGTTGPVISNTVVAVRYLNTNPAKGINGNNTYNWVAATGISSPESFPWGIYTLDGGGTGTGLPLSTTDNGLFLGISNANPTSLGGYFVLECRTSGPHYLKTGQMAKCTAGAPTGIPVVAGPGRR